MSGYFAGLMRQTGIGPAAPPASGFATGPAAPAPAAAPEEHLTVDAAPPPGAPPAFDLAPARLPSVPDAPPVRSIPAAPTTRLPAAEAPRRASAEDLAPTPAPPAPPEVTIFRAASPSPPLVVPPAGAPERRVPPHARVEAEVEARADRADVEANVPPSSIPPVPVSLRGIERTVMREVESAPAGPPVRAIPSPPPASAPETPRTMRIHPMAPGEAAAEVPVPAAPSRVHAFTEVLSEARRWVAETPAPGEPRRPEESAMAEADGYAPAPAAPRPRRQSAGITEASEEVHVSIGAITVTIEDPAAARPAPAAPAPRPEPDFRSRLSRVYLRPE